MRQDWAQGRGWTPESLAVVQILSDMEDLRHEDIVEFYGSEDIPRMEMSVFGEEDDSPG